MNPTTRLLALIGLVLPLAIQAAEQYNCYRMQEDNKASYQQIRSEYVELMTDNSLIKSRIHIGAATKEMTFSTCQKLATDGSNFSLWFETECRKLVSADTSPYTIEPFLLGAYAGISPVIDKAYPIYEKLKSVSEQAGVASPERTFVIYANKKPLYEFFCYPRQN